MNRSGAARRRGKYGCAVSCCVLAIGIAARILLEREPKPALQIARLFAVVKEWSGQPGNGDDYFWLDNDRSLIIFHSPAWPRGRLEVLRSHPAQTPGSTAPLPFATSDAFCYSPSPDGQYLAYIEVKTSGSARKSRCFLVVRGMDGTIKVHTEWLFEDNLFRNRLVWAPDSSYCVQLDRNEAHIQRVSLKTGRREMVALPRVIPLDDPTSQDIVGVTNHGTALIARERGLLYDPANSGATASGSNPINVPRMSLVEVSLEKPGSTVHTYSPAVPAGAGIGYIVVSPQGDRIFWGALCGAKASPLVARIHRWLKFVPAGDSVIERGWVSRLDGSGMKEIGFYALPAAALSPSSSAQVAWINNPKWTPDGKRISFVYRDRIMTIPAD